jgi:hypothetical protein
MFIFKYILRKESEFSECDKQEIQPDFEEEAKA